MANCFSRHFRPLLSAAAVFGLLWLATFAQSAQEAQGPAGSVAVEAPPQPSQPAAEAPAVQASPELNRAKEIVDKVAKALQEKYWQLVRLELQSLQNVRIHYCLELPAGLEKEFRGQLNAENYAQITGIDPQQEQEQKVDSQKEQELLKVELIRVDWPEAESHLRDRIAGILQPYGLEKGKIELKVNGLSLSVCLGLPGDRMLSSTDQEKIRGEIKGKIQEKLPGVSIALDFERPPQQPQEQTKPQEGKTAEEIIQQAIAELQKRYWQLRGGALSRLPEGKYSIVAEFVIEVPPGFDGELQAELDRRQLGQVLGVNVADISIQKHVNPTREQIIACLEKHVKESIRDEGLMLERVGIDLSRRSIRAEFKNTNRKPVTTQRTEEIRSKLAEFAASCGIPMQQGFVVTVLVVEEPPPRREVAPQPVCECALVMCRPCGILGRLLARIGLGCGCWLWTPWMITDGCLVGKVLPGCMVACREQPPCKAQYHGPCVTNGYEVPYGLSPCHPCGCGCSASSIGGLFALSERQLERAISSLSVLARAEQLLAYFEQKAKRSEEAVLFASAVPRPAQAGSSVSSLPKAASSPAAAPLRGRVERSGKAAELFGRASTLFWAGKFSEALELLDEAVSCAPADPRLWYFKGLAEQALGRSNDARRSLARAILLHETASAEDQSLVTQSLSRLQGKARRALEEARLLIGSPAAGQVRGTPKFQESSTSATKVALRP